MTSSKAKEIAQKELNHHPNRLSHTFHVADFALKLANHYGVDSEKALIVAYLHDVTKYWPEEKAKTEILAYYSLDFMDQFLSPTLHALSAAAYAKRLGIDDEEIINAILFHPSGRKGMSLLEKIQFVADYAEESRSFDNQDVQSAAFINIDKAVFDILSAKLSHIQASKGKVMPFSIEAMSYYQNRMNGGME